MRIRPRRHASATVQGFTLIELMIAVAVVAILVAVALPQFRDSIRKGRRTEAFSAISAVQQAQERERARFPTYCNDLTSTPTQTTCGLQRSGTTPGGYYTIALSDVGDLGYTVTATAAGSQVDDTRCGTMAARLAGGALKYGSGSSINWAAANPDASGCWAK